MSATLHGAAPRALALSALTLLAPLALGGAPAWSQATLSLCAVAAALQLAARGAHARRGARLSSPLTLWLAGPLLSLLGALISLVPLGWLRPHLSEGLSSYLAQLTDPLGAAALGAAPWGGTSLTPAETLSWAALQATFCLTSYLSYHLHPHRLYALRGLALSGAALTLYGLAHETLGLQEVYGLYASSDRDALTGFITPIINKNSASSLMLLSALTSLGLASSQGRPWLLSAALSALGVWRCEARGALLAGLLALGALALLHPPRALRHLSEGRGRRLTLTITLALIGAALTLSAWWTRATHLAQLAKASWSTPTPYPRFQVWRDALAIAQERWALGVGRGAFGEVFTRHQTFSHRQWISHVESHPLEQLIEGGALGLLGGALLPAAAWVAWRVKARGESHVAATALWLGIGAVGLHQCLDFGLNQAGLALPLAVAWGALWSYLGRGAPHAAEVSGGEEEEGRAGPQRRRGARVICCAALLTALLSALALHTAPSQLRPTLARLAHARSAEEGAALGKNALQFHPTSAHITQQVALGYARALGLWRDEEAPPALDPSPQAPTAPHESALRRWLHETQRRAPRFATPSLISARLHAREGLPELADLSYLRALNLAPWRLKEVLTERRARRSGRVLELSPLRPELRAPALEELRRLTGDPREARRALRTLPLSERLKLLELRAQQLSLCARSCRAEDLECLQELEEKGESPDEPCPLALDRIFARALIQRCSRVDERRAPPLSALEPRELRGALNLKERPALDAALERCAPRRGAESTAWSRFRQRLSRADALAP